MGLIGWRLFFFLTLTLNYLFLYLSTGRKSAFDIILQSVYFLWINISNTSLKLLHHFAGTWDSSSGVCFSPPLAVAVWVTGSAVSNMTAVLRALHSTVSAAIVPHSTRTSYGLLTDTQGELFPPLLLLLLHCETGKAVTCSALFITTLASTTLPSLSEQWLSLGAFPHSFVEQEWRSFLVGAQGSGIPLSALAAAAPHSIQPPVLLLGWDYGVWNPRSSLWRLWHPHTGSIGSSALNDCSKQKPPCFCCQG